MTTRFRATAAVLAAAVVGAACDDDTGVTPPETRSFEVTVENVSPSYDFPASGAFDTPRDADVPGPIFPGGIYEVSFHAAPGHALSFATMFVQSNDLFYAPDGNGIALFDGSGAPVSGDVTDQVLLWDAGTEEDQEPGLGGDQAPRQAGPDSGAPDDDPAVRLAGDDYGNLPMVGEVIRVVLEPTGSTTFTLRIENVSNATTLATSDGATHPVPLSPGVFVIHPESDPLFTVGQPVRGSGLEDIAEDGAASGLAAALADRTGINGILSPGAWVVHREPSALFEPGAPDRGEGLEAIAEDGMPGSLVAVLQGREGVGSTGAFDTPDGAAGPGPLTPGGSYMFTVEAQEGDRLSLATMYVQSNDLFYAPAASGIELFPGGSARSGDVTDAFLLWDAGTEVNQVPGFGPDQAPRQAGPDTGEAETGVVHEVDDGYTYPAVDRVLRVRIAPGG
jgi:hypothetical protein